MVAIAANYLDNFFSNKSNAFIIAFLMMLASWSLAFTSIALLGLAISSVCVLFLLFVLLKVPIAQARHHKIFHIQTQTC